MASKVAASVLNRSITVVICGKKRAQTGTTLLEISTPEWLQGSVIHTISPIRASKQAQ